MASQLSAVSSDDLIVKVHNSIVFFIIIAVVLRFYRYARVSVINTELAFNFNDHIHDFKNNKPYNATKKPPIVIGILTMQGLNLVGRLFQEYGNDLIRRIPGSLWIVDADPIFSIMFPHAKYIDAPNENFICNPKGNISKITVELFNKFRILMNEFLADPDNRWLYRGTDDVLINVDALERYITYLDSTYDPLTQPLFFGNCHTCRGGYVYYQGGAGYVMSRKFLEDFNITDILLTLDEADDHRFTTYMIDNYPDQVFSSTQFLGHNLDKSRPQRFPIIPDLLPVCPKEVPPNLKDNNCGINVGKIIDIVFWHTREFGRPVLEENFHYARDVAPPYIYAYQQGTNAFVCQIPEQNGERTAINALYDIV